jgi:hypothetical protein
MMSNVGRRNRILFSVGGSGEEAPFSKGVSRRDEGLFSVDKPQPSFVGLPISKGVLGKRPSGWEGA